MPSLSYEVVAEQFKLRDYRLLSQVYKRNTDKLDYVCPQGHFGSIAWMKFRAGQGCIVCGRRRNIQKNTGQKRSAETCKRISEAKKNPSQETRRKMSDAAKGNKAHLGKHHSEETKRKLRVANLGKKHSPETIQKRAQANKGKKRSPEFCEKMRIANTGKTYSAETRKKIGDASRNRVVSPETRAKLSKVFTGRSFTPEWREKISKAQKGKPLSNACVEALRQYWANLSEEERKERMAKVTHAALSANPSSIEIAIRKALDLLGISYIPQHPIGWYHIDIFIPCANFIIECDGDYWHNLPGAKEKDQKRDVYLRRKGYEVVRIWEHEIRKDAQEALLSALETSTISYAVL